MSDQECPEPKPSDVVGTENEFVKVENTLPEQHSAKGLQPIIPLPTTNNKTGRTIGSMGKRQEKDIQQIIDNTPLPQKEQKQILTPEHELKQDSRITGYENRSRKEDIPLTPTQQRAIKHQELEKDIQRITAKQDANVNADKLHEEKKDNIIETPQQLAKKIETQLQERNHLGKQEINIFQDIKKNKKEDVELSDDYIDINKQEVDMPITSTGLEKRQN